MSIFFTGCVAKQHNKAEILKKSPSTESYKKFDDIRKLTWGKSFEVVGIASNMDTHIQKAYFYKSRSTKPRPLIVSLHTWSGDYQQMDQLAELCEAEDLNYIHPDFRGPNFTQDACCSEFALSDIDASITYAIENSKVDTTKIYVIGVSGGGYATLGTFMKSKHRIKKFSAWASISSLVAWYNESRIRGNNYAANILACTGSKKGSLDKNLAQLKSPLYWTTPVHKLEDTSVNIYTGIYDGIQGSVPITHSINFYNCLSLWVKLRKLYKFGHVNC
jgi:esterase/lipase